MNDENIAKRAFRRKTGENISFHTFETNDDKRDIMSRAGTNEQRRLLF